MTRMKALAGGLLLLASFAAQASITVTLVPSFDGTRNTKYPLGDKPVGGGDTCITAASYTCDVLGTATANFDAVDSNTQTINCNSTSGFCMATTAIGSEANRHIEIRVFNPEWNSSSSAVAGIYFGSSTWESGYAAMARLAQAGVVRCRTDNWGVPLSQTGQAGTSAPIYIGLEYTAATNMVTCWESANGTDWVQIGTEQAATGNIGSGNRIGVFVNSNNDGSPVTMSFDVIENSTTLSFADDPPPPADTNISNLPGGPDWPSGIGQAAQGASSGMSDFQGWAGREADAYAAWCSQSNHNTWAQVAAGTCAGSTQVQNALDNISPTRTLIIPWPFIPQSGGNKNCVNNAMWDQAAAGDFDDEWASMAAGLRAHLQAHGRPPADPNVVLRLNWEMSGSWYPWSVCGKVTQFKTAWAKVVTALRAEIPGILIAFEPARTNLRCSHPNLCSPKVALTSWMPDPAYFDFIGRSLHNEDSDHLQNGTQFIAKHVTSGQTSFIGLDEIYDVAVANSKKISFTEWGSPNQLATTSQCGADHQPVTDAEGVVFLQGAWDWMNAKSAYMGYETYFSTGCQSFWWPASRQSRPPAQLYDSLWNN